VIRRLGTLPEATAALAYFNAFHDGFIRELVLRSHDRFESRGVHAMSGRLDLDIRFAHYNYREGEPPADQMIRASFRQVRDLRTDIPHWHGEWSIDRVEIEQAVRRAGAGDEACLLGRIVHHRLVDGAWTTHEGIRFTFADGEMEELFG
jgi:hypothetical protein